MKKRVFIWLTAGLLLMGFMDVSAMSMSKIRKHTRFLSDRMAYELNLSPAQYEDVYEINFDFIYNVESIMDDVARGYDWALDDYYRMLDVRNDDLRWVLSANQYGRFMGREYFYRPLYASGNSWNFRVYIVYNNHNYFYFGKPRHYRTYAGGHYRTHYNNVSYYANRYHHDVYNGHFSTRRENVYLDNRRKDFGVTTRPSSSSRPSTSTVRPTTTPNRPATGTSRPTTTTTRPSTNTSRPSSSKNEINTTGRSNSNSRPSNSSGVSVRPGTSTGKTTRPSSAGTSTRTESSRSNAGRSTSGNTSRSSSARPSTTVKGNSSSNSRSSSATRSSSSSSGSSSRSSSGSERGSSQGGRR